MRYATHIAPLVLGGLATQAFLPLEAEAGPPKFYVSSAGTVVDDDPACPLFESDAGLLLVVEGLDEFDVGDRLWVEGAFLSPCPRPVCGGADGCVPSPTFFELFDACGTLGIGPQGCLALYLDDGTSVAPQFLDGFTPGEQVRVVGKLVEDALPCFPAPLPAVQENTIEPCPSGTFEGCGQFQPGPQSCLMFHADSGESFLVDSTGGGGFFEPVYVQGTVTTFSCFPPIESAPGLTDIVVGDCEPEIFSGCGTIGFGPQGCTIFTADDGSGFYALSNYGEFVPGDSVFVEGPVPPEFFLCFPIALQIIENDEISPCNDVVPFTDCGTVVETPFCGLALNAESGGVYLLNETGAFGVGDVVAVEGLLDTGCITIPECQTSGCLDVGSISACGETFFSGCGELLPGPQGCLVFHPDSIDGIFSLASFGSDQSSERYFVSGPVTAETFDCFPFVIDRIENTTVTPCCSGADLDGDCIVGGADLGLLLGVWGPCAGGPTGCLGDLDGDGVVGGSDLGVLLAAWTD